MRKSIVLLSLSFFIISHVIAQNLTWVNSIGNIGADEVRTSRTDAAGNVYVAGMFSNTVDFNPGAGVANISSVGNEDVFIARYDAAGNYVWAKGFGGSVMDYPNGIDVDGSGNVYITGTFQNTVDFNPDNPGINVVTATGLADIFFIKYNAAGNFLWVKTIGGINNDVGYGLKIDNSGNILVSGTFYNSPDFDPGVGVATLTSVGGYDMFLAKYDANGNYLWARSFGSATTENFWNLDVDNSGNVYTIGYFQSTVNFNAGSSPAANLTSSGILDIVIAKYNAAGNYVWAKKIGGTGNDYGRCIKVDNSGHIYITGYFTGTVDFNPSSLTNNITSAGLTDIYLAKYDTSGNYIWAKKMGGTGNDNGWTLDILNDNIYTTGYFASPTANFNPAGTANLTNPGGTATSDGFLAKYDTSGSYQWAQRIGGNTNANDFGYAISVSQAGDIYIGGSFSATVDFDFNAPVANRLAVGANDIFIAKYTECPLPTAPVVTTLNTVLCSGDSTTISVLSGNLNGASYWQWYTGSCGGTQFDTGTSIQVAPAVTTVYYVRGEGGCLTGGGICNSITINVNPLITTTQALTICQNDSIFLEGAWRKTSGIYYDTLQSVMGCDSINITTLSVVTTITSSLNPYMCQGDSLFLGGAWRKFPGIYYDTLQSAFGCDSVLISTLSVHPIYAISLNASICQGDSLFLEGAWRTIAGIYYDSLQSSLGCDSVIITSLIIKPIYFIPQNASICQGDSLFLNGAWRKFPGVYTNHYQSSLGCDSNIITTLIVHPKDTIPLTFTICQGDSLFLQGTWRKTAGMYYDVLVSSLGCDSVLVSTLIINPKYTGVHAIAICEGDSIFLGGNWRKIAGTYYDTLQSAAICDSVIITNLSVDFINPSVSINGLTLTSNTNSAFYQWLDCINGFSTIPGATNQSYVAAGAGDYAVIVTKGTCYDTSACYHVFQTDIAVTSNGSLAASMYPNPVKQILYIDLTERYKQITVQVRDISGRLMSAFKYSDTDKMKLNLSTLPPALYIVQISADEYYGNFKIMKQ